MRQRLNPTFTPEQDEKADDYATIVVGPPAHAGPGGMVPGRLVEVERHPNKKNISDDYGAHLGGGITDDDDAPVTSEFDEDPETPDEEGDNDLKWEDWIALIENFESSDEDDDDVTKSEFKALYQRYLAGRKKDWKSVNKAFADHAELLEIDLTDTDEN